MDTAMLVGRVLLSLACVVGILWYASRRLSGSTRVRTEREASLRLVGKQSVSRHAGVAVLAVGNRRILVGYGDQQVTMLSELAPVIEPAAAPVAKSTVAKSAGVKNTLAKSSVASTLAKSAGPLSRVPNPRPAPSKPQALPAPGGTALSGTLPDVSASALRGSVLDPQTWRTFVRTLQDRTVRR